MSLTSIIGFILLIAIYITYLTSKGGLTDRKKYFGRILAFFGIGGFLSLLLQGITSNAYLTQRLVDSTGEIQFVVESYALYSQSFVSLSSTMSRMVTIMSHSIYGWRDP